MSNIRSKNTRVELLVFRELRRRKIYFQKHYGRVPGSPDIALPRKKRAVFIDGDFWHGHEIHKLKERHPEGSYWLSKIERNMERDRENDLALKGLGWKVLRIWEHEIKKDIDKSVSNMIMFLK